MKRFQHSLAPVDSISSIDEQLAHSDYAVEDGEIVWVRSVRCAYVYRKKSGLVADGISVVATAFGTGLWVRMTDSSDPSWRQQATWFISPVVGSDENSGLDITHALKTDAERQRRWNGQAQLDVAVTIDYVSDLPSTDPVNFDVTFGTNGSLAIVGQVTVVKSGVFNAVTASNAGTQTPWRAASTPAFDGSEVKSFLQVTSGPNVDCYMIAIKDNGGGSLRLSQPGTPDMSFGDFSEGVIAHADPYHVLSLTTASVGTWSFGPAASDTNARVTVDGMHLVGLSVGLIEATTIKVITARCVIDGVRLIGGSETEIRLSGSELDFLTEVQRGSVQIQGGAAVGLFGIKVAVGADVYMSADFIMQEAPLDVLGSLTTQMIQVFDVVATAAIEIEQTGSVFMINSVWGTNPLCALAVRIRSGGSLYYNTTDPPTVTGADDLLVGGTVKTWGALPFANATNLAVAAPFA